MKPTLVQGHHESSEEDFNNMDALKTWAAFFSHYNDRTGTPFSSLQKRYRLAVAGVNGAGKTDIEELFDPSIVLGSSSLFTQDLIDWWNALSEAERQDFIDRLVKEENKHLVSTRSLKIADFKVMGKPTKAKKKVVYDLKNAFGGIFTYYLQIIRDKDIVLNGRPGYPEIVIERQWQQSLHMPTAVFSGARTLSDFQYLIEHALLEHVELAIVYVDSDIRQKDNIRGVTEQDLLLFRHDLLRLFEDLGGKVWIIESNCSHEVYKKNVALVAREIQEFMRVT